MIPRGLIAVTAVGTAITGLIVTGRPHHHRPAPAHSAKLAPVLPLRASRGEPRPPLPVKRVHRQGPSRSRTSLRVAVPAGGGGLDWTALSECESSGNPHAVDPSGTYFGLYQFDILTWRSVGGRGNPADASRAEQTLRARILYGQRGRAPWPVCGANL